MNMNRGCGKWVALVVAALVALFSVAVCASSFMYARQRDEARAKFAPPTVFVTQPATGVSAPVGSYLVVAATATSPTSLTHAELWSDGQLVDTLGCDQQECRSPFYVQFDLQVAEGPHMLFVRAANTMGMIGQSLPIGVVGEPAPDEVFLAVPADPGETLADIATAYETEPEVVGELNPGLGDQELPGGTHVTVPAPPEDAPPDGQDEPSVGPPIPTSPSPPGGAAVPMPPVPPLTPIDPLPLPVGPPPLVAVLPPFQPPAAPNNLQGRVEDCMVQLTWKDNANNELRYEIWMATLSGASRLVDSLNPAPGGAVWVEFPAPRTGALSFWVEAVGVGGSQPSNIVWLEIDPACPTTAPTHLEVEARDMSTPRQYDNAYCYMSFEKAPEQRIPRDDSAFIQVLGGRGDIATWASGSKKYAVPIPADGALDLEGECWAWSGDMLDKLGTFRDTTISSQWNGTRLPLKGDGYEIGYAIQEQGGEGDLTTYEYEDPTIPPPYDLQELPLPLGRWPWLDDREPPWVLLRWKWDGDESKIDFFNILLNGAPHSGTWHPDEREVPVPPPRQCDGHVRWEMSANNTAQDVRSPFSAPLENDLPKCQSYVRVTFKEIRLEDTRDGIHLGCARLQVYFRLSVNDVAKKYWGPNFFVPMKCGTYEFPDIIYGDDPLDHVFTVPLSSDPNAPHDVWVQTRFWDYDNWPNPDDAFGKHTHHMSWPNLKHAQDVVGCGYCGWSEMARAGPADTEINYCIEVFPNPCYQLPTKVPRF